MPLSADLDPEAAIAVLEKLANRLAADGWQVRLHAPADRRPMLHVANTAVAFLCDLVTAGQGKDGQWWVWWSWAERIAPADDLDRAAVSIGRVLASRADSR